MRIPILLTFTSFIAAAQPRLSAPVAGYVFDGNTGSIRAVMGIPGASSAGDRLNLNDSLSVAFLHSSLPIAAGVGKDGSLVAANWSNPARPQQTALTPRFGPPDRIVFAGNANRALLISAGGVELWSGLGSDSAALIYAYPTAALGGTPRSAAVSNDGTLAAVVLDSARIIETSESGLRAVGAGQAASYGAINSELYLVNSDGALARGDSGNVIATGLDASTELSAVTGFNGVVALSTQKGTLSLMDAVSGQLTRVDCGGCKPTHAQALATPGLLYFEDSERGGLMLDLTTGGTPRIVPVAGIDGRSNQ